MTEITEALAQKVLTTVDAGLCYGAGVPEPGKMCVEAAVCFALGIAHSDNPPCVAAAVRSFKIRLNDSGWSSNAARAKGMRRVAIAQLGSTAIDQRRFAEIVSLKVVQEILPIALRVAMIDEGLVLACEKATTLEQARAAADAAALTAAHAAHAAVAHAALTAARAAHYATVAAYAAAAAAAAADADAVAADADADAAALTAARAAVAAARAAVAADADAADAAARAAHYATVAADAADAHADADADAVLSKMAEIAVDALKECGAEGCQFLYLTEAASGG